MAKVEKILELEKVTIRKSEFNLDFIEEEISAIVPRAKDEVEAILCLTQEIKKIKAFLNID